MNGTRIGAAHRQRLYASTTDTYDETADLDYIAIEYALNGEPITLTLPEKIHAAQLLDARGYDLTIIGRYIGADRSTVSGWRDRGWTPPVDPQPIDIGHTQHGPSGYAKGCRCRTCRNGARDAAREHRARARRAATQQKEAA